MHILRVFLHDLKIFFYRHRRLKISYTPQMIFLEDFFIYLNGSPNMFLVFCNRLSRTHLDRYLIPMSRKIGHFLPLNSNVLLTLEKRPIVNMRTWRFRSYDIDIVTLVKKWAFYRSTFQHFFSTRHEDFKIQPVDLTILLFCFNFVVFFYQFQFNTKSFHSMEEAISNLNSPTLLFIHRIFFQQ